MRAVLVSVALLALVTQSSAAVFLNEIFINPPGSLDDTREYIELMGTPGMKLDGYAVALISGGQQKIYSLGSVSGSNLPEFPEVDEFFSLDGLELGANGLLVIGIGIPARYPTLLPDTNFAQWSTLWNGGLDTTGKLQNDGSNSVFLLRNRPGRTEADPVNPGGLRWGKDISPDAELESPFGAFVCVGGPVPGLPCDEGCTDCCFGGTCAPGDVDRYGNGAIDKGEPNGMGGNTLDLRGYLTPFDITDDLEIVDEISYEGDKGWEHDVDSRQVDLGSNEDYLPERKVHALDDPQGFNPDMLTRVDYRTKGPGWTPAVGAVGELPNGNNWQDTATEQWIRGETAVGSAGQGSSPFIYFSNADNSNSGVDPNQAFETNVPRWLVDGVGAEYDFSQLETYQVMAGRINPLATPFVPGDVDRDGDCDAADIAKIAAVFGDADWIFSNSYAEAPEGKDGDPALQTRPWDVDGTGADGIEASDLQWVLNFQGDVTGQVVGRTYDSTTPAASGVALNANAGTTVTVSVTYDVPNGRPLSDLRFGDVVDVRVAAEVTSGANLTAGEENGVMQFVQDVLLETTGVARLESVTPMNGFAITRGALVTHEGVAGDAGVSLVNGHTTAFDAGLGAATELYAVTLRVISAGATALTLGPAAAERFAASTPLGVKLGHTDMHGDPAAVVYPLAAPLVATGPGDADGNSVVDVADLLLLVACLDGPENGLADGCGPLDLELDNDADIADWAALAELLQ
jgi:hypothetical protein